MIQKSGSGEDEPPAPGHSRPSLCRRSCAARHRQGLCDTARHSPWQRNQRTSSSHTRPVKGVLQWLQLTTVSKLEGGGSAHTHTGVDSDSCGSLWHLSAPSVWPAAPIAVQHGDRARTATPLCQPCVPWGATLPAQQKGLPTPCSSRAAHYPAAVAVAVQTWSPTAPRAWEQSLESEVHIALARPKPRRTYPAGEALHAAVVQRSRPVAAGIRLRTA